MNTEFGFGENDSLSSEVKNTMVENFRPKNQSFHIREKSQSVLNFNVRGSSKTMFKKPSSAVLKSLGTFEGAKFKQARMNKHYGLALLKTSEAQQRKKFLRKRSDSTYSNEQARQTS